MSSTVDVKLINTDDNEKYEYPTRSLEIRVSSSKQIITPTRAATDYEFNQKAQIPTDITVDNPIYTSVTDLNCAEFKNLMYVNGHYDKIISNMEKKSGLSIYSNLRLFLLMPTVSDQKDEKSGKILNEAPMAQLKSNTRLLDSFIRTNIRLQRDIGLKLITIPFIELPFSQYKDIIRGIYQVLDKSGEQPVFFIDMRYKDFKKTIDLLANDYQTNMIGVYHRKYRHANINYDYLTDEYSRKDIAFLAASVERSSLQDISTMHYLPFMGNDVYAIKRKRGFPKYAKDENGDYTRDAKGKLVVEASTYTTDNIKFFNRDNLRIENINTDTQTVQRFLTEYDGDYFITSLLKNYRNIEGKKEDVEALRAFSRVSELKSSQTEFTSFQKLINENSTSDYIDEKTVLKQVLNGKENL